MKGLLAVFVLFVFVMLNQVYSRPDPFVMKCLKETNATDDEVLAFFKTGDAADEMKCYMKCMLMNNGKMTKDGKFPIMDIPDVIKEPEELKKCHNVKLEKNQTDLCELAYKFHVCILEATAAMFKIGLKEGDY